MIPAFNTPGAAAMQAFRHGMSFVRILMCGFGFHLIVDDSLLRGFSISMKVFDLKSAPTCEVVQPA